MTQAHHAKDLTPNMEHLAGPKSAAHALEPLVGRLQHVAAWRIFMGLHVFAVWDFMSLLKRLQRELTCTSIPWLPGAHGPSARFINEIVLAEESDSDGQGGFCSHFELYRRGMREAGADDSLIMGLLQALQSGSSPQQALAQVSLPAAVRNFVAHTLQVAADGTLIEVAATFLYGREAVLPQYFVELLEALQVSDPGLTTLAHYFRRHIEVDGDEHGPMAQALLATLCGDDEGHWRVARASAERSLTLRIGLWKAIEEQIDRL